MSGTAIQADKCYVCGSQNPKGLNIPFIFHGDFVAAEFMPADHYCGFDGIVHGGILFALVDESMMHLIHGNKIKAITSEVTIRMKRFARANENLIVRAHSLIPGRHLVTCKADISDRNGMMICRASGKFLYYADDQPFKKSGL